MFIPLGTEQERQLRTFPIVTITIASLIGFVFVAEVLLSTTVGAEALQEWVDAFGVIPAAISDSQDSLTPYYLSLFTAVFVHTSVIHVGFNLVYLLAFGDSVEDRLGHIRFLVFFFVTGLAAGLIQTAINPDTAVPSVGASGAIAGVLAGYLVLFPEGFVRAYLVAGPLTRISRAPALIFAGIWFVLQFFSGVGSLGVATIESSGGAYWSHLGGFGTGLMLAWLYKNSTRRLNSRRRHNK